jgi:hypothetical protein
MAFAPPLHTNALSVIVVVDIVVVVVVVAMSVVVVDSHFRLPFHQTRS